MNETVRNARYDTSFQIPAASLAAGFRGEEFKSEGDCAKIGLLLLPGFAVEEYALFAAALDQANLKAKDSPLQVLVVSEIGGMLPGNCGSYVETKSIDQNEFNFDFLFVFGDAYASIKGASKVASYVRRLCRTSCVIGAIGGAVMALAKIGLLEKGEVSIHWQRRQLFSELGLSTQSTDRLCSIGHLQWTSCGRTSTLDLALHLISKVVSTSFAIELAQDFVHSRSYDLQATQSQEALATRSTGSKIVNTAIALFQRHIEFPISMRDVCVEIGISQRQLERQFSSYCGISPLRYYRSLQLESARELTLKSDLTVMEIALATGFQSVATLTKNYREKYGYTPTAERRQMTFIPS